MWVSDCCGGLLLREQAIEGEERYSCGICGNLCRTTPGYPWYRTQRELERRYDSDWAEAENYFGE